MTTTGTSPVLLTSVKTEKTDPPVKRRKPRVFASLKEGIDYTAISLDFCTWLHRNFDGLVTAINAGRLAQFQAW